MSFVSARELEAARLAKKEQQSEMRQEILREAKESFEKEKKREEQKRARGDDIWILPAVKKRLGLKGQANDAESEKKKRKKKKEKKHKKHKTSSKSTKMEESGSSESDEEGEGKWVEKQPNTTVASTDEDKSSSMASEAVPPGVSELKRDDWMTMPLGASDQALSILTERQREGEEAQRQKDREKEEANFLDKPGKHPRELNPFWKDGGLGLPTTHTTQSSESGDSKRRQDSSSHSSKRGTVGDGGHSWLLRAYKRVLEQSSESGKSVEEIATHRWGSLDKLYSLLRAAGIDPENPDAPPKGRGRREYLYSRNRRLDEDRDKRSMEGFDRRQEDRRRRRTREDGESYSSRSDRGRFESARERDDGRERRRRREDEGERKDRWFNEHKNVDLEERKRDLKERFKKPPSKVSSESASEFLKPGDLDQGRHSYSTGIRAGLGTTASTSAGWKRKDTIPPVNKETEKLTESEQPSLGEDPQSLPPATEGDVIDEHMRDTVIAAAPVTEAQLNSLGAKLMKAELMGNNNKIETLKSELERLQEVKKSQDTSNRPPDVSRTSDTAKREERTLVLTKTDRFGREKPVQLPSSSQDYRPPSSKGATHSKKGKREKYFQDDDRYSLKELVEQERMMTAEETHAAIARMASKFVPAAGSDETVDDLVESKSAMKYNESKELDKAKKRSMIENRKMANAMDKCQLCFDSHDFNKHLLIAVGMNTYLCAPWHTSLAEGHCYIVPMEHVTCSLYLDENVWSEIEIFRKGLTRMFAERELDVVFMETYTSVKRKTHMYIDCIPIPREEGELAPMYFKKAILESDEEWAQNKKLVDTKEKGVRGSLPTGLPYFFAEFGMDGGFGHVIEDLDQFPHYFGREIVGGLLDLNPRLWLKPRRDDFDKQKAKVMKLSEWWTPYDWTQKLQQTA